MIRTSVTHPLQIASVAGSGHGRIGITFCPGKYDPYAQTGSWDRDLALDLDAIKKWGASAVVTLVEDQELKLLRVPNLGAEVRRRAMSWFHLPIVDVSTPDQDFHHQTSTATPKWWVELRSSGRLLESGPLIGACRGP
jgi:ADP-ribosyl-[dinitrogen reductase] hydrolase